MKPAPVLELDVGQVRKQQEMQVPHVSHLGMDPLYPNSEMAQPHNMNRVHAEVKGSVVDETTCWQTDSKKKQSDTVTTRSNYLPIP